MAETFQDAISSIVSRCCSGSGQLYVFGGRHGAAVCGGQLYVFGGQSPQPVTMSCFNPKRILVPIALSFLLADLARENGGLLGQRVPSGRYHGCRTTSNGGVHVILLSTTLSLFYKGFSLK
ncbi:hypothetical protein ACROYT_G012661 [Oculina patagonica]